MLYQLSYASLSRRKAMERETGIEPATNSLEGCDSTTELLPPGATHRHSSALGASAILNRTSTSPARQCAQRTLSPGSARVKRRGCVAQRTGGRVVNGSRL